MAEYSMPNYFQNMTRVGRTLSSVDFENSNELKKIEEEIHSLAESVCASGRSDESLNESGQMTAMQRIMALVDEGTWLPLNSLYNPEDNANNSTGIIKGLGCVEGKWVLVVASDNKN